nr:hypothetical protein [uncultured Allomuricauda sp.]
MHIGLTLLGLLFKVSCKQREKSNAGVAKSPLNIIFIMSDDHAFQAKGMSDFQRG